MRSLIHRSNTHSQLAMMLALNTTMRGCEIKGLRWRDVDLMEKTLTNRRSKTTAGERVRPLNADAMSAIPALRTRSKGFFGDDLASDWFIFPQAEGNTKPDPTKPMVSWPTAWRHLTREAGLRRFRFHDLRHHAITELAEGQASDQTIRSIAGHVSNRMLEHYSHVRLDAKRSALDALSSRASAARNVTKHVTKGQSDNSSNPQVIENMVDVTGIEPATPCLQSGSVKDLNACSGVAYEHSDAF
jgi:integrase